MKVIKSFALKLLLVLEKVLGTDMRYLVKGGFWLILSQTVGAVASFIAVAIFSQYLSQDDFGVYRYILSFISIVSVLSLPGISTALTQAVSQGMEGSFPVILKTKLRWGALTSLTALLLSGYYYFKGNELFGTAFAGMAIVLPLMNAFYLYRSVYIGRKLFRLAASSDSASAILSVLVMSSAVILTRNVAVLVIVYLVHTALIRLFFLRQVIHTSALNENQNPHTISFGKHLSYMTIIGTVVGQLDKILVFQLLGPAQLSVYFIALAPIERLRGVLGNIETLTALKLATQELHVIKINLPKKIRIFEVIVFLMVIVYILIAPFLFQIFFPFYINSVIYSQIAALTLLFFPRSLITAAFNAHMKTRELYMTRTVGPLIRVSILCLFVWQWGIWGAILSSIASELLLYILYYTLFKRMK